MKGSNPPRLSSTKNTKIVNLRKLRQRKHRRTQNRFMVEGLQLITMAHQAGHRPLDIFYCQEQFTGQTAPTLLQDLIEAGGQPHPVTMQVMNTLSERDAPQGIIVTFPLIEMMEMMETRLQARLARLSSPALFLVLEHLQDPGNLGTLIRTADAVAAAGVILVEPCVDVFDSKTVRGSMGSLFTIPVVHAASPEGALDLLRRRQVKLIGADSHQGDLPWDVDENNHQIMHGSAALVLGNEARGLSQNSRQHLAYWVRLPMLGQAESLNVAIAGAVLMYQWVQQNKDFSRD